MSERLRLEIRAFARERGLLWGVCAAEPLDMFRKALVAAPTPFVRGDAHARLNPKAAMPGVKSVIVLGRGYGKAAAFADDGKKRCALSAGAVGEDYHRLLLADLAALAERLSALASFRHKLYVDNGPLAERPLAWMAGLGFFGRNCSLISNEAGSFFHIGYALTDMALPADRPMPLTLESCEGCRKCVDACPAGALSMDETPRCDATACVSCLTQKKGELTRLQRQTLGCWLYGCDVCQSVCPHNEGRAYEKVYDIEKMRPEIGPLLRMTDEDFDARFMPTAAGWRGRETLRRNAGAALENIMRIETKNNV